MEAVPRPTPYNNCLSSIFSHPATSWYLLVPPPVLVMESDGSGGVCAGQTATLVVALAFIHATWPACKSDFHEAYVRQACTLCDSGCGWQRRTGEYTSACSCKAQNRPVFGAGFRKFSLPGRAIHYQAGTCKVDAFVTSAVRGPGSVVLVVLWSFRRQRHAVNFFSKLAQPAASSS